MALSWLILLLVTMVLTRPTNKLKRAKKVQRKGEVEVISDSEIEKNPDEVHWDMLTDDDNDEVVPSKSNRKGKAPMNTESVPMSSPIISFKRKRLARRYGLRRDTNIDAPIAPDSPPRVEEVVVNTDRLRAFERRECIGERHVNIEALRNHSPEFGRLIEQASLLQVCRFPELLGYCLYRVRTFYTNARHLQETENGSMYFYTNVLGMKLKITPQLIGDVLGMESSTLGINFLKGKSLTKELWQTVIDKICLEGTKSADGKGVRSKYLRLEYRFLNFITCYNILPNLQTKVVRWERLLFLYLIGNPSEAIGLNMNIPYIIWNRMSRYIVHPHPLERLPFPLIIMRILQKFGIDVSSTSYQHSCGMIDESTIVKSLHKLPHVNGKKPSDGTSASPSQQETGNDDEASLTSIFNLQQQLSIKQEQILKEQQRIANDLELTTAAHITITKKINSMDKRVQKILSNMGCTPSDDSDSDD